MPLTAVVPAAGEGTRLRPLTEDRPKALVEVGGQPLLARCLRALLWLEPEEAVVVVGHRGDQIVRRFGDRFEGIPLSYARQPDPRGLARAVLAGEPRVDDELVVLNGDNVFGRTAARTSLPAALERRRAEALDAVLLTEDVPPERAHQGVCVTDERGRLVRVAEHPEPEERRSGTIAAGFYAFTPAIFDACRRVRPSEEGEYELADAVNVLLERGGVGTLRLEGWRINVNTPDDRARAERRLAGEESATGSPGPQGTGA